MMPKAKREITISRDYFKMVSEKVINNIGDYLNTEAHVPFVKDCAYVMSVLEAELFGRGGKFCDDCGAKMDEQRRCKGVKEYAALEIIFKSAERVVIPARDFTEYEIYNDQFVVIKDEDALRYVYALNEIFSLILLTKKEWYKKYNGTVWYGGSDE